MTVGLNASQARAKSQQDMIIFNECDAIMRAVIEASSLGKFETYVSDNTIMTQSSPVYQKIGTVNNPVVTSSDSLSINNQIIPLGITGVNLNSVVADINDAQLSGITASKDSGFLVLDIEVAPNSTWTFEVDTASANAKLGLVPGVYNLPDPQSTDYFAVWQGTLSDRAIVQQMNAVQKHFANLGYKIERITNSQTSRTFKWHIYW